MIRYSLIDGIIIGTIILSSFMPDIAIKIGIQWFQYGCIGYYTGSV